MNISKENAIIVGAGGAGKELLNELYKHKNYLLKGFIDDYENEKINGYRILGKIIDLPIIIKQMNINIVFIAIPSSEGDLIKKIFMICINCPVKIKVIPRFSEIILGRVNYDQLRDISIEDMFGRRISRDMFENVSAGILGKKIIVFGAAGSIGSKLALQIVGLSPQKLVLVDWWENGIFNLQEKIRNMIGDRANINSEISFIIGNIQDRKRMSKIFNQVKPDVIFNAAAYKHVPLMESNHSEAIKNNILGSKILYELSIKYKISSFILISSDKAVNPTNIMGATKRVTEKMMHYYSKKTTKTSFLAVRFGNVINSNGSVIPTFQRQISEGELTVTHKDMVRYFMSIDEAVYLILQCWDQGRNDEIFILDMGEPIKIIDVAHMIIKISGMELNKDIKIKYIGLRPGEKLYEEPMTNSEMTVATKNEKIYILSKDEEFNHTKFMNKVNELLNNCDEYTFVDSQKKLIELVPTYKSIHQV